MGKRGLVVCCGLLLVTLGSETSVLGFPLVRGGAAGAGVQAHRGQATSELDWAAGSTGQRGRARQRRRRDGGVHGVDGGKMAGFREWFDGSQPKHGSGRGASGVAENAGNRFWKLVPYVLALVGAGILLIVLIGLPQEPHPICLLLRC
ncbi:hypothetical protein T484DRAFT_2128706 [Baffinella frigidus]|nr:hypothetical protein T484DRAFT_2128706 [Cryptophyta sp. CCMP2293]